MLGPTLCLAQHPPGSKVHQQQSAHQRRGRSSAAASAAPALKLLLRCCLPAGHLRSTPGPDRRELGPLAPGKALQATSTAVGRLAAAYARMRDVNAT